jgi:hypothetical protein
MLECRLVTWTTYGTWLPGDPRGYGTRDAKQTFRGDDQKLHQWSEDHLKGDSIRLDNEGLNVVAEVLRALFVADNRLIVAAVERVHCHLVADVPQDDLSRLMQIVKGRSSYALGTVGMKGKIWSRRYQARLLSNGDALENAVAYVRSHDEQGALIIESSML